MILTGKEDHFGFKHSTENSTLRGKETAKAAEIILADPERYPKCNAEGVMSSPKIEAKAKRFKKGNAESGTTAGKFGQKADRFQKGNVEAACIILSDPERYAGLTLEWATLFAYRMVTGRAGQYPELERLWARVAYDSAFSGSEPGREGLSEDERNELSDSSAWCRR